MKRTGYTVTVVAATVAVLAVALPVLGDTLASHGGTPTDVYTATDPDVCQKGEPDTKIGSEQLEMLPMTVTVGQESHLVTYLGGMWSGFKDDAALILWVELFNQDSGVSRLSPGFSVTNGTTHNSGTIMWTFENVNPGTYTMQGLVALFPARGAFVEHGVTDFRGANIQNCALTVFVNPVVQ